MKSAQTQSTLQVSVLHGDLNHTNHPILLGHYEGDTIAGAERVVDKMVVGALSQRYHLGCYPGRNGTAAVALVAVGILMVNWPTNQLPRARA